jgi:hypothetical protein
MLAIYNSSEFLNGTLLGVQPPEGFVECLNLEDGTTVGSVSGDHDNPTTPGTGKSGSNPIWISNIIFSITILCLLY